ncbi:MAG: tetratricopeptide repeat protein [Candidatus Latescibacteria bacterium]|nr:tetratricopeptide repeat protein [Candidatus Latescibacterota bacterium]
MPTYLCLLTALLLGCASEPEAPAPPAQTPPPTQPPPAPRPGSPLPRLIESARGHLAEGRYAEAIAACEEGLKQDSTAVPLYNLMANAYAADGRYAPAIDALQHVLRLFPTFALAHVNLAGIYTKLGQYADAEDHLKKALAIDPKHAEVHRRLGEVYLGTDRYPEAVEAFAHALARFPEDATLYFYLGQALEGAGREADALNAFSQSVHLDIGFPEALYRLAVLARRLNHAALADSALGRFQHLQAIGKGDPEVPKQMKKLRASILTAPEDPIHHFRLGAFFAQHAYLDEALDKIAKAARLQPPAALLNQMGGLMLNLRRPQDALTYYRQAIDTEPTYMPALVNAANLLSSLQRHAEALPLYQKATQLAPQVPNTWYFLGMGRLAAGDHAESRQALEKALSLCAPDNPLRPQIEAALGAAR